MGRTPKCFLALLTGLAAIAPAAAQEGIEKPIAEYAERVWDTQRILDSALSRLPGIDPRAVVLTGNSGGGVPTVYAAALDRRITVAVPSCSLNREPEIENKLTCLPPHTHRFRRKKAPGTPSHVRDGGPNPEKEK